MKAGKAYISSLGTTGLLIASSVLLLMVVGTMVAFDGWPDGEASADPAIVSIQESQQAVHEGSVATRRQVARATRVERRRAAATTRRRARGRARARARDARANPSGPSIVTDPVISDLPAPDAGGTAGGSPGAGGGGGAAGVPTGSGGGGETTRHLGDVVANVSPQAGTAIGDLGQAVDQAVETSVPGLIP